MEIDNNVLEYLEGEKFSNRKKFNWPSKVYPQSRVDFLAEFVKGKKVIHLGCLDHGPLITDKVKNKTWIHGIITDNAEKCIGFDIEEDLMHEVSEKFGVNNIICEDITLTKNQTILAEKWDYLILGELLEHVDNPVDFLAKLKESYGDVIEHIVVTVPNILNINRMKEMKNSQELINTDHRYWFTPYTIAKVSLRAGIKPMKVLYKTRGPLTFSQLVYRKIYKTFLRKEPMYPFYYFNSLVLIGKMK